MPYGTMDEVPENMKMMDGVELSLEQVNKIAEIYDSIKAEGKADNLMAIAKSQFKKSHKIENGKWMAMAMMAEIKELEIFAAGKYPQGEYTEADLSTIAGNYDPAYHEAPAYVDHPNLDGSRSAKGAACGWINKVYVKGKKLLADVVNVPESFMEVLKSGQIKKRSVEIYPDLDGKGPYLRALAWLGADVPQVKGLKDVVFDDTKEFHTCNYTPSTGRNKKFADKYVITYQEIIKEKTMSDNDKIEMPVEMKELQANAITFAEQIKTLTADIDSLKTTIETLKTENEALKDKQALSVVDARKSEIKTFCDQMVTAFKMTPAERAAEEPALIALVAVDKFGEGETKIIEDKKAFYLARNPMQSGEFDKTTTTPELQGIEKDKAEAVKSFNELKAKGLTSPVGVHVFAELYQKGYKQDAIIEVLSDVERKQLGVAN